MVRDNFLVEWNVHYVIFRRAAKFLLIVTSIRKCRYSKSLFLKNCFTQSCYKINYFYTDEANSHEFETLKRVNIFIEFITRVFIETKFAICLEIKGKSLTFIISKIHENDTKGPPCGRNL